MNFGYFRKLTEFHEFWLFYEVERISWILVILWSWQNFMNYGYFMKLAVFHEFPLFYVVIKISLIFGFFFVKIPWFLAVFKKVGSWRFWIHLHNPVRVFQRAWHDVNWNYQLKYLPLFRAGWNGWRKEFGVKSLIFELERFDSFANSHSTTFKLGSWSHGIDF